MIDPHCVSFEVLHRKQGIYTLLDINISLQQVHLPSFETQPSIPLSTISVSPHQQILCTRTFHAILCFKLGWSNKASVTTSLFRKISIIFSDFLLIKTRRSSLNYSDVFRVRLCFSFSIIFMQKDNVTNIYIRSTHRFHLLLQL